MRRAKVTLVFCAFLFVLFGLPKVAGGQKIRRSSAPHTSSASGQEMYAAYCASCHGIGGTGNGPAAPALKSNVPDLTSLGKRNKGKFPTFHVMEEIRGELTMPHTAPRICPFGDRCFWPPAIASRRKPNNVSGM